MNMGQYAHKPNTEDGPGPVGSLGTSETQYTLKEYPMSRSPHSQRVASLVLALGIGLAALPAQALVNGTPTTGFEPVGELGGGSGVLISANWVLTAAHVAAVSDPTSLTFSSGLGLSAVDQIYTFSSEMFPAHDIALVHLAMPLAGIYPILNDLSVGAADVPGLGPLTIATGRTQFPRGYGRTSAVGTTVQYTNEELQTSATVNWIVTRGDVTVEGGDSGGALFKGAIEDSEGQVLLGITSALLTYANRPSESAFVQTAAYREWIDGVMATSGQRALWVSAVPEPSAVALLIAGALVAGAATRARQSSPGRSNP